MAANGIYGKSGDEFSPLYDLLYTFKTTIAGQLFISLWIETLTEAIPEIKFLQVNTDGITYIVPKNKLHIIKEITNNLTKLTGLIIEDCYYKKMIIKDVKVLRLNLLNCWKPKA